LHLRENMFRRLLKYAFHHSPFYRQYYFDHGIKPEDLNNLAISDLPAVDKKIIKDNFNEVVVPGGLTKERVEDFLEKYPSPEAALDNKYRVIHSSGSTGEVGYYLYGPREWDFVKAITLRTFPHFSLKPKKYVFVGATDGHYAGVSLFKSPVNTTEEFFYRDNIVLDINDPLEKYADELNRINPDVITGYPNGIALLAKFQKEGKLSVDPKIVVCGGEPTTPQAAEMIKNTWNCELINNYATSESLVVGVGRPGLKGFYLFDDANYIEFMNDHILLTNLYNYTQPLIRYRLNDVLVPEGEGGVWPFTRIKNIIGRQEELLWFPNQAGEFDFIHPIVIAEIYVRGVDKYQVVKTGRSSFIFKAVINSQFNRQEVVKKIEERLGEILQKKEMANVEYRVEPVNDLEKDPKSGKFKLITQKQPK